MKFKTSEEYQLLRNCLKLKELKLTPELADYRNNVLSQYFSKEDITSTEHITEEFYSAELQGKQLSSESIRDLQRIFDSTPDLKAKEALKEYMDTYVTFLEFSRINKLMKTQGLTDPELLAWLQGSRIYTDEETIAKKSKTQELIDARRKDKEDRFKGEKDIINNRVHIDSAAPSTRVARFAETILTTSPSTIADNYAKFLIEGLKIKYKLNPDTMNQLSMLQRNLLALHPKNIKAPQKRHDTREVVGNFLDDIRAGKDVRLSVANVTRTARGRGVLQRLLIAGVGVPLLAMALNAKIAATPENQSTYKNISSKYSMADVFTPTQLTQIQGYEVWFAKYEQEGVVPSTSDLHDFINSLDNFYSNSIKEKLLESYNEYADENDKPHAKSIKFEYNDTEKNDGPRDILTVVDETGKSYTVDTTTLNLFEHNNISVIYGAERRIDGYRDDLNALPNAQTKQNILTRLQEDFYKVLDALTLDYTFERNGIVQRLIGDDFKLVSQSKVDELTELSAESQTPLIQEQEDGPEL